MCSAGMICYVVAMLNMPKADFICEYAPIIIKVSREYSIKPLILVSLIQIESEWKPDAKSKSGACGLGQIIPKFWKRWGVTCKKLMKPKYAITITARIFGTLLRGTKEKMRLALCKYNVGRSCSNYRLNERRIKYVNKVLNLYGKMWLVSRKVKSSGWVKHP